MVSGLLKRARGGSAALWSFSGSGTHHQPHRDSAEPQRRARQVPAWLAGSLRAALVLMLLLVWAGCATPGRPIITERGPGAEKASKLPPRAARQPRSGIYVVKRGDTLYSIAWRFGLDMKTLARDNGLRPPYTIYPRQRLSLRSRARVATAPPQAPASRSRSRSEAPPPKRQQPAPASPPPKTRGRALVWQWPTSSPVVREFGGTSKGLDFEMKPGTPVSAAAPGEVVYAGSGLGGYQRLVIVKHNDSYLSAYSLNQPFNVREGQRVRGGDRIASIAQGSAATRKLHFEIRRDGNPVSPRSLMRDP